MFVKGLYSFIPDHPPVSYRDGQSLVGISGIARLGACGLVGRSSGG